MLLMIDNYDSFTYNLVQYFYEMNQDVEVYRNDEISINEIKSKAPEYLVISPVHVLQKKLASPLRLLMSLVVNTYIGCLFRTSINWSRIWR